MNPKVIDLPYGLTPKRLDRLELNPEDGGTQDIEDLVNGVRHLLGLVRRRDMELAQLRPLGEKARGLCSRCGEPGACCMRCC